MKTEEELIEDLKVQIIEALSIEDMTPAEIDADAPLFGEGDGLNLDSIDAIELVLLIEKQYHIHIDDPRLRRTILASVRSMAKFIMENQKE